MVEKPALIQYQTSAVYQIAILHKETFEQIYNFLCFFKDFDSALKIDITF